MLMFSTASFLDFCWFDQNPHIVTVSSGCIFTATYSCRADASVWSSCEREKQWQTEVQRGWRGSTMQHGGEKTTGKNIESSRARVFCVISGTFCDAQLMPTQGLCTDRLAFKSALSDVFAKTCQRPRNPRHLCCILFIAYRMFFWEISSCFVLAFLQFSDIYRIYLSINYTALKHALRCLSCQDLAEALRFWRPT